MEPHKLLAAVAALALGACSSGTTTTKASSAGTAPSGTSVGGLTQTTLAVSTPSDELHSGRVIPPSSLMDALRARGFARES